MHKGVLLLDWCNINIAFKQVDIGMLALYILIALIKTYVKLNFTRPRCFFLPNSI
jgi:hypothetical protein